MYKTTLEVVTARFWLNQQDNFKFDQAAELHMPTRRQHRLHHIPDYASPGIQDPHPAIRSGQATPVQAERQSVKAVSGSSRGREPFAGVETGGRLQQRSECGQLPQSR